MADVFEYVKSIQETKKYLMESEQDEKDYNCFLTNKALSQHIDSILYANEMNQHCGLPSKLQYDYYWHSIRKMKRRFGKWPKQQKTELVELLMKYYKVNRLKAEIYQALLSEEQIKKLEKITTVGGDK